MPPTESLQNQIKIKDRRRGAIYGALVGDALGVPFEFKRAEQIPRAIEVVMPDAFPKTYPAVPYGTYSDDGALMLCVLESLYLTGDLDEDHLASMMVKWLDHGHNQSGGIVFDCGYTVRRALERISGFRINPRNAGAMDARSNGNGSLMRTLPIGLLAHLWKSSTTDIVDLAHRQSAITHAHPISMVCCAIYSVLVKKLLDAETVRFDDCVDETIADLRSIYSKTEWQQFTGTFEEIIAWRNREVTSGSGYVVDTLWLAIDTVKATTSYREAVTQVIKIGNDTDTNASVTGGLAGIRWGGGGEGDSGIPLTWRQGLCKIPIEIDFIIDVTIDGDLDYVQWLLPTPDIVRPYLRFKQQHR